MQEGFPYIKDSNDFIVKIKDLKNISKDALTLTADVVGLQPQQTS